MDDLWWRDRLKVLEKRGLPVEGVTYLPMHAYREPYDRYQFQWVGLRLNKNSGNAKESLKTNAAYPYHKKNAERIYRVAKDLGED